MRLSHMADRWKARLCRRFLQKWAESCVESYAAKVYPAQLGPFGSVAAPLGPSLSLNLDAALGTYTYEVNMSGSSTHLQELVERFKDSVVNTGPLSPPHKLSMSEQGRRYAQVPAVAVNVLWAYPMMGMAEANAKHNLTTWIPTLRSQCTAASCTPILLAKSFVQWLLVKVATFTFSHRANGDQNSRRFS